MTESVLAQTIAEFYGDQYHGHPMRPNVDGNAPLLALLSRLHDQVFPGYSYNPAQVLAQGAAQLRGKKRHVEHFFPVCFEFVPLSGDADPLHVFIGVNNHQITLWADDLAIDERIQNVLRDGEQNCEDTIS